MDYNYQEIVDQLKNLWNEKTKDFKPSWFKISIDYVVLSSEFLLGITDILVNHFKSFDLPGLSKKEKCIEILSELFDFVAKNTIPTVYKPFSPILKTIIVNCILSTVINFIVKKYQKGSWSTNEEIKK
jgi:hypothetical protein